MLWDQYKTAGWNRSIIPPGPGGWWYHHAPTEDRARIQQHGLFPSLPKNNPKWPQFEVPDQPEGVYLTNSPEALKGVMFHKPMDTWRVPAQGLEIYPDPIVGEKAVYTPQHLPNPELFRPYEKSNEYSNRYEPGYELPYESGPVPEDWVNYHDWHELGNPSDEEWESYGIGQDPETWKQAGVFDTMDPPAWGGTWPEVLQAIHKGWTPGNWGKGWMTPLGNVMHWNVEPKHQLVDAGPQDGWPAHTDVINASGYGPGFYDHGDPIYFSINPKGNIYSTNAEPGQERSAIETAMAKRIMQHTADIATPMGWSDMYHVAPRSKREQIMSEGLQGHANTESPWAAKQPWNQPRGNYMFDNPEDAHAYVYTLHHQLNPKADMPYDADEADHEDMWEYPEPPEGLHEWPMEKQDEWYESPEAEPTYRHDDPNGYDIWRVRTHGLPIGLDPESQLHERWMADESRKPKDESQGFHWNPHTYEPWDLGRLHEWHDPSDSYDPWGQMKVEEGEEPKRYYVPVGVHPSRVELHEHVPSWNLGELQSENVSEEAQENQVPSGWWQTPMTEWPMQGHDPPAGSNGMPTSYSNWRTAAFQAWKRGQPGRGLVSPNGEVYTWPEDEGTHMDMAYGLGIPHNYDRAFAIDPEGRFRMNAWGNEAESLIPTVMQQAYLKPHPYYYPDWREAGTEPKPWEAKMFHGKPNSRGIMGPVRTPFWTTSFEDEAHGFAGGKDIDSTGSVHPVSVRFHNPAHFFAKVNWGPESLEVARQRGHDGVVVHWPANYDDPSDPYPPRTWAIALDPGTVVPGHLKDQVTDYD